MEKTLAEQGKLGFENGETLSREQRNWDLRKEKPSAKSRESSSGVALPCPAPTLLESNFQAPAGNLTPAAPQE